MEMVCYFKLKPMFFTIGIKKYLYKPLKCKNVKPVKSKIDSVLSMQGLNIIFRLLIVIFSGKDRLCFFFTEKMLYYLRYVLNLFALLLYISCVFQLTDI